MLFWTVAYHVLFNSSSFFFRDTIIHNINDSLDKYNVISWLWIHLLQTRLHPLFPKLFWHWTQNVEINGAWWPLNSLCLVHNFLPMICTSLGLFWTQKMKSEPVKLKKFSGEIIMFPKDFKHLGKGIWRWQSGAQH